MKTNYLGLAGIVSHNETNTTEYNRLLEKFKPEGMLSFFETWIDGEQLECFLSYVSDREREQYAAEKQKYQMPVDCDGNKIFVGDTLVMMNPEGLSCQLYKGRVFTVDKIKPNLQVELHPTSALDSQKPSEEVYTLSAKRFLKIIL